MHAFLPNDILYILTYTSTFQSIVYPWTMHENS